MDEEQPKETSLASKSENPETTCWGCGLRLLLPSHSPIFKCGWCGAITNRNKKMRKPDSACFSQWRCIRDNFFVIILFVFMSFVICAGVWAVYPVVFSIGYTCGIFHCVLAAVLSACTISMFCLAAFLPAGGSPDVVWGSYPAVVKGGLENYTFCAYCTKPKCPRSHHCRSCKMCVLDMDHHCPFGTWMGRLLQGRFGALEEDLHKNFKSSMIGNCVGAANHRHFIRFLISIIISCTYVFVMATYAGFHTWPPLSFDHSFTTSLHQSNGLGATKIIKEILAALANSALLLSARGLILVYLALACLSVEIGVCALLWQQLQFIYQGKTYIGHLSSSYDAPGEKGCQNILRFFGCPYWVFRLVLGSSSTGKSQEMSYSKIL